MFNDNSLISIDIGSKFIKIVQSKTKSRGISIEKIGYCPTPKNTIIDGNISDRRDIIKSVSDLIYSINFKSKNVIFGVKGQDIIIRHIEMPVMSDKQLNQAVKLEIQQYLPMDQDNYVIDCKKIGKIDTREKKTLNVLMVAAPKKKIEDYYYIADKLELKIKAIDLFANSITRIFQQIHKDRTDILNMRCVGMLDIGYETSTVTLIEGGRLFLEREFNIGIKKIDQMVQNVFAATPEQVDAIRNGSININSNEKDEKIEDPRVYYANNTARQILDPLIENIMKVSDFYVSSGFNKKVDCLFLYGGGSKLNGISEFIKNSTNIETKLFDCDILNNVYNIDDRLRADIGLYVNCVSLLLRKE